MMTLFNVGFLKILTISNIVMDDTPQSNGEALAPPFFDIETFTF